MATLYYTFGFILIALIVGFVVALIKPRLFAKPFGKHATRPRLAIAFVILFLVCGAALGTTEPASVKQARLLKEQQKQAQQLKEQHLEQVQEQLASAKQAEADKRKSEEAKRLKEKLDKQKAKDAAVRKAAQDKITRRNYWHKVVRVVDGDTVRALVDGKEESVRVLGIDAPESTTATECFGVNASDKAKTLLEGKWIQLEVDDSQDSRDKYSRLLAHVWLGDSVDFGKLMIDEGYAYEYAYASPYQKQTQYKKAQETAKSKHLGLWASNTCNGQKQVSVAAPKPTPVPTPAPKPQPVQSTPSAPASNCDPNYTPCIRYVAGNALNCPDIGIMVRVIGVDHHRFDADDDGYGCDSYQ